MKVDQLGSFRGLFWLSPDGDTIVESDICLDTLLGQPMQQMSLKKHLASGSNVQQRILQGTVLGKVQSHPGAIR